MMGRILYNLKRCCDEYRGGIWGWHACTSIVWVVKCAGEAFSVTMVTILWTTKKYIQMYMNTIGREMPSK
jgi:hypothetical protein